MADGLLDVQSEDISLVWLDVAAFNLLKLPLRLCEFRLDVSNASDIPPLKVAFKFCFAEGLVEFGHVPSYGREPPSALPFSILALPANSDRSFLVESKFIPMGTILSLSGRLDVKPDKIGNMLYGPALSASWVANCRDCSDLLVC